MREDAIPAEMSLDFILAEMGSHWRILGTRVMWLTFALEMPSGFWVPWLYGVWVEVGGGRNGGRESNEGIASSWSGITTFTFVTSFKYDEILLLNGVHQQRPTGPTL